MSGGSYGYLYCKDAEDLIGNEDLDRMVEKLGELGYANDVAVDAEGLKELVTKYEAIINNKMESLSGVFKAVEWWVSGDHGEDGLRDALQRYRYANVKGDGDGS